MIVALLVVILGAGTLLWFSWLGFVGRLPRNPWAGIRLPYTMRSDDNWMRTHRAAGPILIFSSVASLATGLAFLPFAAAGAVSSGVLAAVVLVQAVIIGIGVTAGTIVGLRKARAADV